MSASPQELTKVARVSRRGSAPGERRGGRVAGTPNKATREVKEIASVYGPAAIERAAKLAGLVLEGDTPVGMALSEQAQISALNIILERAYGKASQTITGEGGGPIQMNITRIELVAPNGDRSN